jgi:hypothetical protein
VRILKSFWGMSKVWYDFFMRGLIQTCAVSGQNFTVTEDDLAFYKKMGVPAPTLCPDERARRRLAWRNERVLYKRKCDGNNQTILSVHPENSPFKVYSHEYFFGEDWDVLRSGMNFDFNQPFLTQFKELQLQTPRIANYAFSNENAEYGNLASWNKDCYMCFEADNNRGCTYCSHTFRCIDCLDCTHVSESELCAHCIDCQKCYNVKYSIDSKGCSDSFFLKNCISCKNCFGCVDLKQKQYYWLNEPLTKEEYESRISKIYLGSSKKTQQWWDEFIKLTKKSPMKFMHGLQNENSSGDYLYNCKNAQDCYDGSELYDCRYCYNLERSKDAYDINIYGGVEGAELVYECHGVGRGAFNTAFGNMVYQQVKNCWYSDSCAFSDDLFGCISVYHKKHCILNKSYTKHEYETLRGKIVAHMKETGEWGEFFPIEMSPFGYNETVAQEYFPLTKEEVLKRGYGWKEEENPPHSPFGKGGGIPVPDDIKEVDESILKQILYCDATGRGYKIQKSELDFYQKMDLPIPRLHPDERHKQRMVLRNPRKLWERACADCEKVFQTTYAPERPEKVLCESCYLKVVD